MFIMQKIINGSITTLPIAAKERDLVPSHEKRHSRQIDLPRARTNVVVIRSPLYFVYNHWNSLPLYFQ